MRHRPTPQDGPDRGRRHPDRSSKLNRPSMLVQTCRQDCEFSLKRSATRAPVRPRRPVSQTRSTFGAPTRPPLVSGRTRHPELSGDITNPLPRLDAFHQQPAVLVQSGITVSHEDLWVEVGASDTHTSTGGLHFDQDGSPSTTCLVRTARRPGQASPSRWGTECRSVRSSGWCCWSASARRHRWSRSRSKQRSCRRPASA